MSTSPALSATLVTLVCPTDLIPPASPATRASAASALARCSGRGRDTSLARIAALVVTFIVGTAQLSLDSRPGPGRVQSGAVPGAGPTAVPGAGPATLWRHRDFMLLWAAGAWVFFSPLGRIRVVPAGLPQRQQQRT